MKTILIIDDDPSIRTLLAAYLTQEGYLALTAPDGALGLLTFESEQPDTVLCDLAMPGLGGLEVLAEVRHRSPLTPFIVISGTGDLNHAIEAMRLGAWDFLVKPLPELGLLKALLVRMEERVLFLKEKELYQRHLEEQIQARTAQLTRQLKEKGLLLVEVQHRVKNNLQIILVLLDMEHEHSGDPKVRAALDAVRTRIHTLALVQEEMHDTEHATLVRAQSYGTGLIHHLLSAHGLTPLVDLTLDLEDLTLPAGLAFTWGLVLNELMAALAAAGPILAPWSLTISLKAAGAWSVTLTVIESRGVWARWVSASGRPSMGWNLVSEVAAMGGGSLEWSPEAPETIVVHLKQ